MEPNIIGSTSRVLGLGGAILLISASAALGAYYGYTVGAHHHMALGVVFAAAALGGEILKPLAVVGAIDAGRAREFGRAMVCAVLAFICVVYSLASELSLAAGSRGDLAASRDAALSSRQSASERRRLAFTELDALAPSRPEGELHALAARLRATPGANNCDGMPDGPISRRVCGEVADLEAEAARSKRRRELETRISEVDATLLDGRQAVGVADPLASTLATYARALGIELRSVTLSPWLALVPVLFLEVGSAFALVVTGRRTAVPDIPETPKSGQLQTPNDDKPSGTADAGAGQSPSATVIELLKTTGGELRGGQRGIAKALGVSKSRANELLHKLADTGQIHLETSPNGTFVRLAAG